MFTGEQLRVESARGMADEDIRRLDPASRQPKPEVLDNRRAVARP
jgi:hypothetical protein